MTLENSKGQCRLCGSSFDKRQMTRHIKTCWSKKAPVATAKKADRWFHLVVEGGYDRRYWLHLQASGKATFGDLDSVLRNIWLECCDHMSDFQFKENKSSFMAYLKDEEIWEESLQSKLYTEQVFSHIYDYGSTTKLGLRVVGDYSSPALPGNIKVLARNDRLEILCVKCKQPATQVCTECIYTDEAALCDACASKHECGEEMLSPIVDSPRTGVCGYTGPSIEP